MNDQMTEQKTWKVLVAIEAAYVPHPGDYWAALQIRAFAKWWMDLCRNFIVVAVLQFFAQRSGSLALHIFADFTFLVFMGYCTSHFNTWHFFFFPNIRNTRIKMVVNMLLWLAVYLTIFSATIIGLYTVNAELIKVQIR
jgi:hypothetical protein